MKPLSIPAVERLQRLFGDRPRFIPSVPSSRRAFLLGLTAVSIGSAMAQPGEAWGKRLLRRQALAPAGSDIVDLAVHSSYDGQFTGGWNAAVPRPTATVRGAKPQPWCVIAFVERCRFSSDLVIGVEAGARDGIEGVQAYWNGGTAVAPLKGFHSYKDTNGVDRLDYLYLFRLKHGSALARAGGVLGRTELFFRAIPKNKPTFEDRVIGPYAMYPALTDYDEVLNVGTGFEYPTLNDALKRVRANPGKAFDVVNRNLAWITAPRPLNADCSYATEFWTRIRSNIPATIGNPNGYEVDAFNKRAASQRWGLNQVHLQGANLTWSQSNMAANGSGAFQMEGGGYWLWRDGIEVTQGTPFPNEFCRFVSGSGHLALYDGMQAAAPYAYNTQTVGGPNVFDTFVWIHDTAGFGCTGSRLVKHCKIERVSGTALQSLGWRSGAAGSPLMDACVYGCEITDIGGWFNGLCWYNPGLSILVPAEAPAWVGFEKESANGQAQYTLTLLDGGSGYTPGTYGPIAAVGGSGTGLKVTVEVGAGGVVTSVKVGSPNGDQPTGNFGADYRAGEVCTVAGIGPGSGFQFRLNGNFRILAGPNQAGATVVYEWIIFMAQRVQELVDDINAKAPVGCSAVSNVVDRDLSTSLLSYSSSPAISSPIPLTQITGSPRRADIGARIDVHANVFATPNTGGINLSYVGIDAYNIIGASPGSMGSTMKDVGYQYCSVHTAGYANPASNGGPLGEQSGYWTAPQSHVVTRYVTQQGTYVYSAGNTREFCLFEYCYFNSMGAHAAGAGLEVRRTVLRVGPMPAAADASTILLSGKNDNDIFAAPTYPSRDLTPKQLGGQYALAVQGGMAGCFGIDSRRQLGAT